MVEAQRLEYLPTDLDTEGLNHRGKSLSEADFWEIRDSKQGLERYEARTLPRCSDVIPTSSLLINLYSFIM